MSEEDIKNKQCAKETRKDEGEIKRKKKKPKPCKFNAPGNGATIRVTTGPVHKNYGRCKREPITIAKARLSQH